MERSGERYPRRWTTTREEPRRCAETSRRRAQAHAIRALIAILRVPRRAHPRRGPVPWRHQSASRGAVRTRSASRSSISRPLTRRDGGRRAPRRPMAADDGHPSHRRGAGRPARLLSTSPGLVPDLPVRLDARLSSARRRRSGARGAPWMRVGLIAIEARITIVSGRWPISAQVSPGEARCARLGPSTAPKRARGRARFAMTRGD